jgi:hypothetical protein
MYVSAEQVVDLVFLSPLDYPYIRYPLGGTGTYRPYGIVIPYGLFSYICRLGSEFEEEVVPKV